ncbi:uncharacterized protein PV09_01136 [Verruconis gallopava]|uniref:F-box domain-containing protein n=1 Tax=Verruconis gallopava TaxID=253628 RepID=A0A0D1XZG0_9PEZI|nr:uncharacterized protein PV09_01136 [Verruconis gallopava]KIW08206.1 hypothetical protein PV09_01136 [Verruconis gallopava]
MLLDLPPEILELILLALPPDSFAIILMTSKALRAAILATPKILRCQLLKLPGLRPSDQATISELLRTFNRRAALNASNGLQAYADVIVNKPSVAESHELWTRPKFNWIQRCCVDGCYRGVLATAADYCGTIHVYRIRKGRIIPLYKLDPRNLGLDEDDSPYIRYRCVAMRWQRCHNTHLDHLVALFGYSVESAAHGTKGSYISKFVTEAVEKAQCTYHLCGWKLCKDTTKPAFSREVQAPPDYEPIIIATTEDFSADYTCYPVAVIFRKILVPINIYKLSIYQVTDTRTVHVPVIASEQDAVAGHYFSEPITRARFTSGRHPELWIFGSDTAPLDIVTDCVSEGVLSLRFSYSSGRPRPRNILFTSTTNPTSFKGLPIKSHHAHECGKYENGSTYCVQTILELVITRGKQSGAFLVKYAEEQDFCSPYNINVELPAMEFTVVAMLLGLKVPSSSEMKHIIALSPDQEWVAIADWDKVKIWGLHTDAFFKQEHGSLPPLLTTHSSFDFSRTWEGKQNKALRHEFGALDDKAYTTNCAQGYFHDHIRIKGKERKRIVGIRPIELPSRGVVFSLAFANKNILWAWTDRGLVKWAWNKRRQGLREEVILQQL